MARGVAQFDMLATNNKLFPSTKDHDPHPNDIRRSKSLKLPNY